MKNSSGNWSVNYKEVIAIPGITHMLPTIITKMDKKEIITSTAKSIFGVIPFGGAALNELFFEYNGRIKQNRLNRFVEILAENFTEDAEIKLENIKTEDFNDLFESVLRRVVQTKSERKLKRFNDILIKELNHPSEHIEIIDHYLDLITSLTEEEITILYYHRYFTEKFEKEIDKLNLLRDNLQSLEQQMKKQSIVFGESEFKKPRDNVKTDLKKQEEFVALYQKYREAKFYSLAEKDFLFFKQRLVSRGLLIENRMNRIGSLSFSNMGITEFGVEFINFIRTSE